MAENEENVESYNTQNKNKVDLHDAKVVSVSTSRLSGLVLEIHTFSIITRTIPCKGVPSFLAVYTAAEAD